MCSFTEIDSINKLTCWDCTPYQNIWKQSRIEKTFSNNFTADCSIVMGDISPHINMLLCLVPSSDVRRSNDEKCLRQQRRICTLPKTSRSWMERLNRIFQRLQIQDCKLTIWSITGFWYRICPSSCSFIHLTCNLCLLIFCFTLICYILVFLIYLWQVCQVSRKAVQECPGGWFNGRWRTCLCTVHEILQCNHGHQENCRI